MSLLKLRLRQLRTFVYMCAVAVACSSWSSIIMLFVCCCCPVVHVYIQTHTSVTRVRMQPFTCIPYMTYIHTYIHAYIHAYLPPSHCLALGVTWLLLPGGAAPSAWALCARYLSYLTKLFISALYYPNQFYVDRAAAGRCPLDRPTGLRLAQVVS